MDLEGTIEKVQESSCVLVQARNLPEGTIEKVQEKSSVLVQARDLPGGPRRYYKKCRKVHLYWLQARNLPGGPRRYYRKSAGKFTCTDAGYVTCCQKSSDLVQEM